MKDEGGTTSLNELRKTMWDQVGIVRSGAGLQDALTRIRKHQRITATDPSTLRTVIETRFATKVAELVASSALRREESRGTHYRTDYPNQSDIYAKPIMINKATKS
jgi:aspartate oxidase